MDGKRFITKMRLRNLLSFGPEAEEFELEPLNVLIGPNASGKSNVIEAISLLQAAPDDIQEPIRRGGGIREWLWRGASPGGLAETATVVSQPDRDVTEGLRHRLAFAQAGQGVGVISEVIEDAGGEASAGQPAPYYRYASGKGTVRAISGLLDSLRPHALLDAEDARRLIYDEETDSGQSVLSQLRDRGRYPEITYLAAQFGRISIYSNWNLNRDGDLRRAQLPDLQSNFLSEDAKNLALIINDLQNRPGLEERLNEELRRFYPRVKKITVRILGGTVQLQLHEEGLRDPIPATRMSDGTLRYLCLLSILLHPEPPPLVCIEEPEVGLHPDIVVRLAQLMEEASQRMQLIVTTHSDALVAALSHVPEAVAVCERDEHGSTALRRLSREDLSEWLERYTLGDLWMMGELGGNP